MTGRSQRLAPPDGRLRCNARGERVIACIALRPPTARRRSAAAHVTMAAAAGQPPGAFTEEDMRAAVLKHRSALLRGYIRDIFDDIDTDKSGFLEPPEFKALCLRLEPTMNEGDVQAALDAMDSDNDGVVDFEECVAPAARPAPPLARTPPCADMLMVVC